jgi:hypothetical protein
MFLKAKGRSWQRGATSSDVDAVLSFCSDSIRYDHVLSPVKMFSFTGKDIWRRGMISHLGESRNVKLTVLNTIAQQNLLVVQFLLARELSVNGEWRKSEETNVSIIEFGADGKIRKLTDYL